MGVDLESGFSFIGFRPVNATNKHITGLLQSCVWYWKYRHQTESNLTKKYYFYYKCRMHN